MQILIYPHVVLRFKTQPITKVDKKIKGYAEEMVNLMHTERGIGLAANQVGLPLRMFVINLDNKAACLLNPVVRPFGKTSVQSEGCLSFPDIHVDVRRHNSCHLKAWTLNGDDVNETISGDISRVIQHEMDHLDGILFIDRMNQTQRDFRPEIGRHIAAFERAYEMYPKSFPEKDFNETLDAYTNCNSVSAP